MTNDWQYPAPDPQPTPPQRSTHPVVWILGALILALLLLCGGITACVATSGGNDDKAAPVKAPVVAPTPPRTTPTPGVTPTVDPTPTPTPTRTTPAPKPKPTIAGDTLVHVGEDVPPGTYRAITAIDSGMCYWAKTRDAEGTQFIANDIPAGGRPQVTLKKGQWFTSRGCPDWKRK